MKSTCIAIIVLAFGAVTSGTSISFDIEKSTSWLFIKHLKFQFQMDLGDKTVPIDISSKSYWYIFGSRFENLGTELNVSAEITFNNNSETLSFEIDRPDKLANPNVEKINEETTNEVAVDVKEPSAAEEKPIKSNVISTKLKKTNTPFCQNGQKLEGQIDSITLNNNIFLIKITIECNTIQASILPPDNEPKIPDENGEHVKALDTLIIL